MTDQNFRLGRAGEFIVLALYIHGPLHGYAAKKAVAEIANEDLSMALTYSTLGRLMEIGLIELVDETPIKSAKGPPKKVYRLTGQGAGVARSVIERYAAITKRIQQPVGAGG